MWSKGLIAAWAILGFFSVSVAIVFAVIKVKLDETVTDSSEMCSSSAPTFEYFESPPTQSLEVWVYNITNPGEFLNGASGADMYELGPYVYDLDVSDR